MLNLIATNLIYVLIAMFLLVWAWSANFIVALISMKVNQDEFDKQRFKKGIWKMLLAMMGTAMLAILITILPIVAKYIGIPLPDEYVQYISIAAILLIFWKTILFYVRQVYEKLQAIFTANGIVIDELPNTDNTQFTTLSKL